MANSVLKDVLATIHQAATDKGLVSAENLSSYEKKLKNAGERSKQFLGGKQLSFAGVLAQAEGLDKTTIADFAQIASLDAMVANAIRFVENAQNFPSTEDLIRAEMKNLRADLTAQGLDEAAIDARIQESLNAIVISFTHTAHPTIFHTLASKRFQQELIHLLEAEGNTSRDTKTGALSLTEQGQKVLKSFVKDSQGFIARLAEGTVSVTQTDRVTLQEEAAMEADNWQEISKQFQEIIAAWNAVHADKPQLQISEERAKKLFEKRTWLRSGDADGRHLSTAEFMDSEIMRSMNEKGEYTGEILDPRQNSQVHKDYIGALVQVKYRNSATGRYGEDSRFKKFCDDFMQQRLGAYNQGKDGKKDPWDNPKRSIFQQLTPQHQAEFIAEMMKAEPPFKLVPEQVKHESLETFGIEPKQTDAQIGVLHRLEPDVAESLGGTQLKQRVRERYKEQIQSELKNPKSRLRSKYAEQLRQNPAFIDIEYKDMIHVTVPYNINEPEGVKISLRSACDAVLDLNGFRQDAYEIRKTQRSGVENGSVLDFWKYRTLEQLRVGKFLQSTRKWNAKEAKQEEIFPHEVDILTGTTRRMLILKHFLDEVQAKGKGKIADRYQIANFEQPADFLMAIKLFEESGLITQENGKVIEAKLDIMPLLETENDLKHATKIFGDLLTNPEYKDMVTSYWKQRGKATIMLGFSDGAASAGNFASQWQIYKTTRELTELFAQHGLEVEFFEGRGRGTDRGGTLDPALRFDLLPPEVTCKGRYDVTIQSDLPMDLAASPAYGKDYFTKILTNTIKHHALGKETRERLAGLKNNPNDIRREEVENVLTLLADKSSEVYNSLVRGNTGAYKFLTNMFDNNDRTSRAASRIPPLTEDQMKDPEKVREAFDKLRAIQKEYRINGIDLPMHHAGLKEGLNSVHDNEALKDAVKHPFFRSFAKIADAGLRNFDPEIAKQYGQSMGGDIQHFVDSTCESVNGAAARMQYLTGNATMLSKGAVKADSARKPAPVDTLETHSFMNSLDQFTHALTLHLRDALGIKQQENKQDITTARHLLFVNAQEVNKLTLEQVQSKVGIAV